MPETALAPHATGRARGRPRSFDRTAVLARLCDLFAVHGYEGLSMAELAAEVELNHPSLYAAFGPKAALYREALTFAEERWTRTAEDALSAPVLSDALAGLFRVQVDSLGGSLACAGMLTRALQTHAPEHALEARHATRLRAGMVRVVRRRLETAVAEGELTRNQDVATIAAYVMTLIHGLAVLAHDGVEQDRLQAVAGLGLETLRGLIAPRVPTEHASPRLVA